MLTILQTQKFTSQILAISSHVFAEGLIQSYDKSDKSILVEVKKVLQRLNWSDGDGLSNVY